MTGFTNKGIFNIEDTDGDGVHIGKGGSFQNEGELNMKRIGGHAVFVADDLTAVKGDVMRIEELIDSPSLAFLRSELIPLLTGIKQELEVTQPSKAPIQSGFANMKEELNKFLYGVNQGVVGNAVFMALSNVIEHAHLLAQ